MPVWPIHLKVLEHESLTSWLARTASALGLGLNALCRLVFQKHNIRVLDLDVGVSREMLNTLSNLSGLPYEHLYDATFLGHEHFYWFFKRRDKRFWLYSPISLPPKKRGIAICPKCLTESQSPYYRKQWRLSYTTVCKSHQQQLIDCCPRCSKRFYACSLHLLGPGPLICDRCYFPILTASTPCNDPIYFDNYFYSEISNINEEQKNPFVAFQFIVEVLLSFNNNSQKYLTWDILKKEHHNELRMHNYLLQYSGFVSSWRFGDLPVSYRHAVLKDAFKLYEEVEFILLEKNKWGIILKD